MPGKKKKYNARFPPARIKKIMQSDEEVGKVAAPVPVIISRALELFAETLLGRAKAVTANRGARTLTPSHLKFCIQSESRFDFLKELVSTVPDLQGDSDVGDGREVQATHATSLLTTLESKLPSRGRGRGRGGQTRPPPPEGAKRRGRPPKIRDPPSTPTSDQDSRRLLSGAIPKKTVEKYYVDDEYDINDMEVVDEEEDEVQSVRPSNGVEVIERFPSPPSAHQSLPFNRSYSLPHPLTPPKLQHEAVPLSSLAHQRTVSSPPSDFIPGYGMHFGGAFHQALPERRSRPPLLTSSSGDQRLASRPPGAFSSPSLYSHSTSTMQGPKIGAGTNGTFTMSPLLQSSPQPSHGPPALIPRFGDPGPPKLGAANLNDLDEDYDC